MRALLTRRGWAVEVATSVVDALPLLDNGPDWVILDLMLPDGDGTDILRKIRAEKRQTRVAVTTGSCDSAVLKAVDALQPDLFLIKPISLPDLFEGMDGRA